MTTNRPRQTQPNILLVLIDSLNRHYLSAYGDTAVQTPNLSAFARRGWRFDNHFVGSLPCMPARREIFAGVRELMWRPWGPLEEFDARGPRLLEGAGYTTAIVTDHYHYWEEAANGYLQAFQSSEMVRGHEIDYWQPPLPLDAPVPAWVDRIDRWRPQWGRRYYSNVKDFQREEGLFAYSSKLYRSLVAEEDPQSPIESGRFIPGVDFPQWKAPTHLRPLSRQDFLFHRGQDPQQAVNLWDSADDQRRRMTALLRDTLVEEGLPPEQLARLGLLAT